MSTPGSNPPPAPPSYIPPGTPPSQAGPVDTAAKRPGEIKLISRSMLFYWWPVWAVAFFCALWTLIEDNRLAVLPSGGRMEAAETVDDGKLKVIPDPAAEGAPHPAAFVFTPKNAEKWNADDQPVGEAVRAKTKDTNNDPWPTRVSRHPPLGVAFVLVLVLVIFTTNVPLRGLWSFVVVLVLALVIVIISLIPNAWDKIFDTFAHWRVHINLAGYLFIGIAVFVLWAVATFIFDPRQFVIFAPGQIRVCEHIGDAIEAYSTVGVQLKKERDDPFRHLLLGFGSSDLVLKFASGDRREVRIPNVLGLNFSISRVEEMIRTVPS